MPAKAPRPFFNPAKTTARELQHALQVLVTGVYASHAVQTEFVELIGSMPSNGSWRDIGWMIAQCYDRCAFESGPGFKAFRVKLKKESMERRHAQAKKMAEWRKENGFCRKKAVAGKGRK